MNRARGSVLIVALWAAAILSLCAVGLGYRASLSLKAARNQRDTLRARQAAEAGIIHAASLIDAGVPVPLRDAEKFYRRVWEDTRQEFRVGYVRDPYGFVYGIKDEGARINVNGTTDFDGKKLELFLKSRQVDEADALAAFLVQWQSPDNPEETARRERFSSPYEVLAAIEEYFRRKGYPDFASRAASAFSAVEPEMTVFGKGQLNLNTAGELPMEIYFSAAITVWSLPDAADEQVRTLVRKVLTARQAGAVFESADPAKTAEVLKNYGGTMETGETNILNALSQNNLLTTDRTWYLIESTGISAGSRITVSAVYDAAAHRMCRRSEK